MMFKLSTAGSKYKKDVPHLGALKELGFKFEEITTGYWEGKLRLCTEDVQIEIKSVEELVALSKACGNDLVVNADSIVIYDDYLE